jgi:CheY-like chemotaxis protein
VIKAENGQKALDEMKEQNVDLVISDLKMPIMDGFEVCRRIKTDEKLMHIPVILITGYAAKDNRIKGIEAGAEDFLSKPIDTFEVIARIKMLLKVKAINEKRIGELLVEMKFITEQQLHDALLIAKEQNLKVGEALNLMGALDKDHIYWVLSNQLKMNYIELSEDMLDKDLIKQFPIDLLERLLCLPLYETTEEIHLAIADPTDQKTVDEAKHFRPDKTLHLHLALPEKIRSLLHTVARELLPQRKPRSPLTQSVPSPIFSKLSIWDNFLSFLFSKHPSDRYWFYRTPETCRLFSQKGNLLETVQEYSQESCSLIHERLKNHFPSQGNGKKWVFFGKHSTGHQGLFHLRRLDCIDKEIILMERTPELSENDVLASHPRAKTLIDQIRHLIETYQRLLIGSSDRSLLKQCCYLFLKSWQPRAFPPPVFVEDEPEFYLQEAVQLLKDQYDGFDLFKGKLRTFLYYEGDLWGTATDEGFPWSNFSTNHENLLVSCSFSCAETMQKQLLTDEGWKPAGFKPYYLDQYELKCLQEEIPL